MKTFFIIFLVLVLLVGGAGLGYWYWQSTAAGGTTFRTATVERGNLLATISATGTVEPEEVVDVGAQVAGQIIKFGQDPHNSSKSIDYGSEVVENTVLAQLDDALFKARVNQAKANLEQAEANEKAAEAAEEQAEADLQSNQAKLIQAERDWERAKRLGPSGSLSGLDYDTIRASYETTKASISQSNAAIAKAKASISQAKASITQAQATLDEAKTNLGYCTIQSPVKGVIVDRRVNIGQTVVASLNAPSLFLIAKDLKRLQVWASVNEADIGNIHPGQPVRFTVDAYPNETFAGEVAQIRLNASMTQNVVTYTVVVNTDNSNLKLLPYLTANLLFEVAQKKNVLLVPNGALRWKPQPQQVAPDAREAYAKSQRRKAASAGGDQAPGGEKPAGGEKERQDRGVVWVQDENFVRPIKVHLGLNDGAMTEIIEGGDLQEGMAVVTGETARSSGDSTTNPFAPQMFGPKKQ
jgi:HlyD family secretion protein